MQKRKRKHKASALDLTFRKSAQCGDRLLELCEVLAQLVGLFALGCNNVLRSLVNKLRVVQLLHNERNVVLDLLLLLAQTRALGLEVDEVAHHR